MAKWQIVTLTNDNMYVAPQPFWTFKDDLGSHGKFICLFDNFVPDTLWVCKSYCQNVGLTYRTVSKQLRNLWMINFKERSNMVILSGNSFLSFYAWRFPDWSLFQINDKWCVIEILVRCSTITRHIEYLDGPFLNFMELVVQK